MIKKQSRDLEEAVAAKLSGREPCPGCGGTGMLWDTWVRKTRECSRCGGKKWVRPELEKYKER
jgi:uncharacterized protein (DUF983 family)